MNALQIGCFTVFTKLNIYRFYYVYLLITFEADETTRNFTVDVNGDTDFEKDETFTVTLSNPSNGAIISTASATGTITNDDDNNNTIPTLAIAATSAVKPEGNTGSTPFTFTVTRTGNTQEESSVDWLILGNKDDFEDGVLLGGTVTFEVDQTSQEINVNVKGDTVIERNEIFQCWIHNPVNATISINQANGIIISDDIALKTIKIVSDYAYTISSDGLLIIDISDPTSPNSIGGFDIHLPNLQKTVQDIAVMGKYAYLVTHFSTIEIIDISDSTNPKPISSFDFSSGFYGIEVVGNYIYVSTLRELKIIDITNPVNPKHIQDFYLSDLVWDVEVEGNYGYVSSRNSGLQIIDVTNPANPKRIGGYDTDGDTVSVEVMGSYLYVADGSAGVQIIDISNPANPKRIGGYDTDGTTWDVKIVEQYAYIADRNAGLQIIDISDPANPTHIKKFNIEGNAWDVEVLGDYAYVATDAGLKVINWNDKEVDKPNDDNVTGTGVILSIPDNFTAVTGSTITVPININTATDLQSLDFSLNYNTTFLNLTAVTLGSLTSDFTITPNINDANGTATVTVSLFGTTAIPSGNGSIAQLNFTVANNATNGSNIPLDLVTASINEGSISTTLDDGSLNITPPTLQVTNFQTTPSGFTIQLSDTINTSVLNLYDGADVTNDLPDLTLVGATKGNIKGSLIWNGSTKTLNFVKTGGLLEADSYTLTLASRSDGFVKTNGDLLDGDANGTTGDNYSRTFSVAANSSRVLSLPDFSRGIGQAVDVAGDSVFGLPIRIDNPSGAIGVDFAVEYDSNLLSLTEVNLGGNIPTGWQVTSNFNTPGQASFSVFGTTALTGNTLTDLVFLTGQVKNTATYGSSGLLKITSTSINEGVISSVGDSAVQLVALFGDATGNQAYSGLDASRIARVGVGIDSGFDPFPLTDPTIIGDITGNGQISGLDASRVAQRAVGISVPAIPNI